jgi:nucleotide-binding universal stress UspA family protein
MFKKILVPVDGSRTSRLGLEEAIKLAKDRDATLYLLHVVEEQVTVQEASVGGGRYVDDFRRTLREDGKAILSDAEAIAKKKNVRTKSLVVENIASPIADVIVNQAKKLKVNLIVLGTHGRRGIKRLVMGSDAEGVVREAPVPVLLVRSSAPPIRPRANRRRTVKRTQARSARQRNQSGAKRQRGLTEYPLKKAGRLPLPFVI